MSDVPDWQRLGAVVVARRSELGMSQVGVQHAGGPGTATLGKIENAELSSIKPLTKFKLEKSLGWAPNSVDRILAGGNPTLGAEQVTPPRAEVLDEHEGERLIIDIVAGVGELSEADRREILALIRAKQNRDSQV